MQECCEEYDGNADYNVSLAKEGDIGGQMVEICNPVIEYKQGICLI